MTRLASALESEGFILHSGGADGADRFFEEGVDEFVMKKIFLPWKGFNGNESKYYEIPKKAYEVAENYHPRYNHLSRPVQSLMARNSQQVLGEKLDADVSFIVCWTEDGAASGGTGQALRIALDRDIPIFNLYEEDAIEKLFEWIEEEYEQRLGYGN